MLPSRRCDYAWLASFQWAATQQVLRLQARLPRLARALAPLKGTWGTSTADPSDVRHSPDTALPLRFRLTSAHLTFWAISASETFTHNSEFWTRTVHCAGRLRELGGWLLAFLTLPDVGTHSRSLSADSAVPSPLLRSNIR